jgi:hypothetical protein
VLAGLPAGALVDRFRRPPLMVWCSLFQGLVLGSVLVAIVCGLMRPVVLANTMVSAGIGASCALWVLYVRDLHWPMTVAGLGQFGLIATWVGVDVNAGVDTVECRPRRPTGDPGSRGGRPSWALDGRLRPFFL